MATSILNKKSISFLEKYLNKKINLVKDWTTQSFNAKAGEVVVLENCRFNVGESDNDENLSLIHI